MINLQAMVNSNGNIKQLQIDTENKTVKSGYRLFNSYDVRRLTTQQLKDIKDAFISDGYAEIE